jgi:hypothetical protein
MVTRLFKKLFGGKPKSAKRPVRRVKDDMPSFVPKGARPQPTDNSPEARAAHAMELWLEQIPADLRPYLLMDAFPQVAAEIVSVWYQPVNCNRYFDQLLIASREGRQGFPPVIGEELLSLSAFYKEKYQHLIGLRDL